MSAEKAHSSTKKRKSKAEVTVDVEDCAFGETDIVAIRQKLLSWYDLNRRKLPWRGDLPPYNSSLTSGNKKVGTPQGSVSAYGTWVSEVYMHEYYKNWL